MRLATTLLTTMSKRPERSSRSKGKVQQQEIRICDNIGDFHGNIRTSNPRSDWNKRTSGHLKQTILGYFHCWKGRKVKQTILIANPLLAFASSQTSAHKHVSVQLNRYHICGQEKIWLAELNKLRSKTGFWVLGARMYGIPAEDN